MLGAEKEEEAVLSPRSLASAGRSTFSWARSRRGMQGEESGYQFWAGQGEFEMGTLMRQSNVWVWTKDTNLGIIR